MNLENSIEVGSVSAFLDAVKQIYCDQDHQLFYRGVSKAQYATPEHDHPGIYRNKSWIDSEDKLFYELTAKCPEYFKDCKTTFEHLVMMQHYGYPTRLLDVTSNPLVALYFACGGLNGANLEDGQLISYHIKKNNIRNYEGNEVSFLSNLVKCGEKINSVYFSINEINEFLKDVLNSMVIPLKQSERDDNQERFTSIVMGVSGIIINNLDGAILDCIDSNDRHVIQTLLKTGLDISKIGNEIACSERTIKYMEKILISLVRSNYLMLESCSEFNIFNQMILKDNLSVTPLAVKARILHDIQCVLPKQNNPRLIAQQGAFLLFGFKDSVSNKTAIPIIPDEMYGKFETCIKDGNGQVIEKQQSSQKAEIIIKGSEKQKILDELKILGISNSTMFPEIDNIANELKSQYAKPR